MLSVIALSKLYSLHDSRIASIQVKGDLIVPRSNRIMTRSRARQAPDQHTTVPAQLKILKILVEELLPPPSAGGVSGLASTGAKDNDDDDDDDEEDGDWEDDPNDFLDLGAGMTKSQLMALGGEGDPGVNKGRDDEMQEFLINFLRGVVRQPVFEDAFAGLNEGEQQKLRAMGEC